MAEETFRKFFSRNYAEFDTGKHFENKDITGLAVDNNEVNTSLAGTINSYGCQSFQGNNIMDEEIPIVPTLTTLPKEIQSNKYNENYADDYIASLKERIGSLKSEIMVLRH